MMNGSLSISPSTLMSHYLNTSLANLTDTAGMQAICQISCLDNSFLAIDKLINIGNGGEGHFKILH